MNPGPSMRNRQSARQRVLKMDECVPGVTTEASLVPAEFA